MKSQDLFTRAELRQRLSDAAGEYRQQADDDAEALEHHDDDYHAQLADSAYAEVVNEAPAVAAAVPPESYHGLDEGALAAGATAYEVAFDDARRLFLGGLAQGIDQVMGTVLQEAVNAIDEIRNVCDEVAVEAAQIAAAAAAGLLVPVNADDVDDFQSELEDARDQARLVGRELANMRARRQASRVAEGVEEPSADMMPVMRQIPGRPLVRTLSPTESVDRSDQNIALVQGAPGQSRTSVASVQSQRLQEMLKRPLLDRVAFIALCAAIGNLARLKSHRDDAERSVEKLRRVYASIKDILSGDFLGDLQASLEEKAAESVARALDFVQSKVDAVDEFLKVATSLPGPFVSTVRAMGDVPDTTPVLNTLASLCGLKADKFCDLQGMIEVAKSIDAELALQIPQPPMFGRVALTLDAPEASQAPVADVVPGQEADLLLVSASGSVVVARFARADAPITFAGAGAFAERADAFGDGPGALIILGNGSVDDVAFAYADVTFNPITGDYTFTGVSPSVADTVPTVRGESDAATITGAWEQGTVFAVGVNEITLRTPEAQARDITMPCDLALGYGEQTIAAGEYDASDTLGPNTVRTFESVFASWMVGQTIDLGPASVDAQAQTRVIDAFVDEYTVTYAGDNVAAHLPGDRGAFRFTGDRYEVRRATAMTAGAHADLKVFALATPTTKPHERMRAIPQLGVRVVPAARDAYGSSATSADGDVRARDITPQGATVLRATYVDASQEAIFTPILVAAATGKVYVDGDGPFAYVGVSDEAGASLRFVLATGTAKAYDAGVEVEVETTSLLDRFAIDFPDAWFDPIDTWLLGLGAELNKLEAKLCRLMSGSAQDLAVSAAALAALATSISSQLTAARFILVAWIVPLAKANSATKAINQLRDMGATRAERHLREGRVNDFVAMSAEEGNDAGATLIVAQSYQNHVETEEQYRILAKAVAELRGRFTSLVAATSAIGDIRSAQASELARKRDAARRIEALQEKLP